MSENYTIGNYTISSKNYYEALTNLEITDEADLAKLDVDGDKNITEDELVEISIADDNTSSGTETEQTETGQTEEEKTEEIKDKYEKKLLGYYEQIENLENQRAAYYTQAGTAADSETLKEYLSSAQNITSQITSVQNQIVSLMFDMETEIANVNSTTAATDSYGDISISTSSDGATSTSISDVDFDFTENLTSGQQSSLEAFKSNWEANKSRYQAVAAKTGVPAELIAAIHWRESSGNFNTRLQDGGSLGSYSSWEESAYAALSSSYGTIDVNDVTTWYNYAEHYNGMGYSNRGVTSPYVWAGTSNYTSGKYVADGVYDSSCVDKQVGVAALLKAIMT